MVSSVHSGKIVWCLLSTVAKLSGVFCPRWQKNVVSFVHPGKIAWCLLGLVSFVLQSVSSGVKLGVCVFKDAHAGCLL